jgi:hypothetical protein
MPLYALLRAAAAGDREGAEDAASAVRRVTVMEKNFTNSGPFMESTSKHSIYPFAHPQIVSQHGRFGPLRRKPDAGPQYGWL